VVEAVDTCVRAGAPGITVHPREDERHIRPSDVTDIAAYLAPLRGTVEFNIEGDPRPSLLDLVLAVRPDQCTLVPVVPGEVTSQAGWPPDTSVDWLGGIVRRLKAAGVRVSLFVDPVEAPVRLAARLGADRIELYTESYASAHGTSEHAPVLAQFTSAAEAALAAGLGINAGHDLNRDNLTDFLRAVPGVQEVSIGHALIADALELGYAETIRDYQRCIQRAFA
jgi:pyridoxine 5-phosphate synthase